MVYILNINLKNNKKVRTALCDIYGIGACLSKKILSSLLVSLVCIRKTTHNGLLKSSWFFKVGIPSLVFARIPSWFYYVKLRTLKEGLTPT